MVTNNFSRIKENTPIFRSLFKTYITLNSEFLVKTYQLLESLDFIVSSEFAMVENFLNARTTNNFVKKNRLYFNFLNAQAEEKLINGINSLNEVQGRVINEHAFLVEQKDWEILFFKRYFSYLKNLLGNRIIPAMLDLMVDLFDHELSEVQFNMQLDEVLFDFKAALFDKSNELLQAVLNQVYEKYGVKEYTYQDFSQPVKNEFSDFEDLDFIEVVDEQTALLLFDLPKNATFNQVQKVYKQMAKQYHPDLVQNTADTKKMQQINFAYSILKTRFLNN